MVQKLKETMASYRSIAHIAGIALKQYMAGVHCKFPCKQRLILDNKVITGYEKYIIYVANPG